MYVITAHQRYGQTDRRTSSDPMTATLLKHVAVKNEETDGYGRDKENVFGPEIEKLKQKEIMLTELEKN